MKQGMTSIDVAALAAELRPILVGGRVEKAYQPEKDRILLRMRRKASGRVDLLCQLGRFITATTRPVDNPDKPSMVAQVLRTNLQNARILDVSQVGFDRILRIDTERGDGRRSIVFEVFGDGNVLLLDGDGTILLPMRGEDFGARRLRRGEPYQPPPRGTLPLELDAAGLRAAAAAAGKDLVRMLAVELGLGPLWAEELCLRTGLDKKARPGGLPDTAWTALAAELGRLRDEISRNDLAPAVVLEEGQPVDAVPFPLAKYPPPRFAHEETPTFREALDRLFVGGEEVADDEDPRRVRFEEARGKLQRQVDQIEEAIGRFRQEDDDARRRGDALYTSFGDVDATLTSLRQARERHSWDEVGRILREAAAAGNADAARIRDLRPDRAAAVLRLPAPPAAAPDPAPDDAPTAVGSDPEDAEIGDHDAVIDDDTSIDVEVDLRKTVQENAETHYAASKKARSRAEGAEKALADAQARVAELESRGLDAFGAAPQRVQRESRHFWFETYRWTLTPSGFLAVGGRNAAQNDAVVKKYLRDGDRYVHADIHGAPSVVLRCAEGTPTPDDLRCACQFAAAGSRAWRQFGHANAYWVTPQQVSKTPRSGEFVPRGAWIVHGKRNIEDRLPMEWAIALVAFDRDGRPRPAAAAATAGSAAAEGPGARKTGVDVVKLVGGPPPGLLPFAQEIVRLQPGGTEPSDAAARIASWSGATIEEAQAALPPGPVDGLPGPGVVATMPGEQDEQAERRTAAQGDVPAQEDREVAGAGRADDLPDTPEDAHDAGGSP